MSAGLCEAKNLLGGQCVLCGAKTVMRYEYGCVHEHIVAGFTCTLHLPKPGVVGCRQCFDAGHECPMLARRLPDVELTS